MLACVGFVSSYAQFGAVGLFVSWNDDVLHFRNVFVAAPSVMSGFQQPFVLIFDIPGTPTVKIAVICLSQSSAGFMGGGAESSSGGVVEVDIEDDEDAGVGSVGSVLELVWSAQAARTTRKAKPGRAMRTPVEVAKGVPT